MFYSVRKGICTYSNGIVTYSGSDVDNLEIKYVAKSERLSKKDIKEINKLLSQELDEKKEYVREDKHSRFKEKKEWVEL